MSTKEEIEDLVDQWHLGEGRYETLQDFVMRMTGCSNDEYIQMVRTSNA